MAVVAERKPFRVQVYAERALLAVVRWLSLAFHAVGGALLTACWCVGWVVGRLVRGLSYASTGVREGWHDGRVTRERR